MEPRSFVSFVKLAPFAVLWSVTSAHVGSRWSLLIISRDVVGGSGFLPSHSGATFLQLQSVRKTEPRFPHWLSRRRISRAHTGRRAFEAVTPGSVRL